MFKGVNSLTGELVAVKVSWVIYDLGVWFSVIYSWSRIGITQIRSKSIIFIGFTQYSENVPPSDNSIICFYCDGILWLRYLHDILFRWLRLDDQELWAYRREISN